MVDDQTRLFGPAGEVARSLAAECFTVERLTAATRIPPHADLVRGRGH